MEDKKGNNIFTRLSDAGAKKNDEKKYPFAIERRIQGLNTAIVVFILFGIASWFFTKSIFAVGLGILLAALTYLLKFLQTREVNAHGYEVWQMEVMEYTYLTRLHRRPTGFYAEALNGPYVGKVCHMALQNQGAVPPLERKIDVYVLGDMEASPVRDVYYIPQYFGFELVQEEE